MTARADKTASFTMSVKAQHRDATTQVVETGKSLEGASAWLEVLNAPSSPRRRLLTSQHIVIGAGLGADVVIEGAEVSRRHAQMALGPEGVEILDLDSRNGTFCDGRRIHRVTLDRDATVQLGGIHVRVVLKSSDQASGDESDLEWPDVVGRSAPMQRVLRQIERLGGTTVPVLIQGESGTGKDLVARAIHLRSPVRSGPFVVVNCAALDPSIVRESLFGQASTETMAESAGAYENAHLGTLYLEEVGALPSDIQSTLARVLDTEITSRVGETKRRKTQVRLIVSSRSPLDTHVEELRFRKELYFRLNTITLDLPPLRDRDGDVALLASHFASEFGVQRLPPEVLRRLDEHSWPGNVRELRNVLQGYAVLGDLPAASADAKDSGFDRLLRQALDLERPYLEQKEKLLNAFIDVYLAELLHRTNGNQSEAARIAGLDRAHLNKMLARLRRGNMDSKGRSEGRGVTHANSASSSNPGGRK